MSGIETDICVIGAGAGGLSVAAGAAQMGARVVLIEGGEMGGDCLNQGCVPSKALLHAARAGMGWDEAHAHVRATIAAIAPHDSQERFEGLGVEVIRAWGRFVSPREVEAGGRRIRARRFVIATGSAPVVPPIPGLADVPFETNETIFELPEAPGHLLIIGGGPIGMEMAQAHRRLGAAVTVIEGARALGREDPEAAAAVLERLRAEGIEIAEGAMAKEVRGAPGAIEVELADGRILSGSHILVAAGRKARLEGLGLEAAGIAHDRFIKVDQGLRTSNRRVFAIGDVAGEMQFTHVAGYQAGIVIRRALFGLPARAKSAHVPRATYTEPELAQIGLTEAEAREQYGKEALEVVRVPFSGNDRAVATGQTEGFVKVMVHRGRPVGVTIVGAGAGELIQLWALAIANNMKLSAITAMIAPYPTLGEINKRAAGAWFAPRLFENPRVAAMVRLVQRFLP